MTTTVHGQVYEVTKAIINPLPDKRRALKHDWRTWKTIPKGTHLRGFTVLSQEFTALVRADDGYALMHPLLGGALWDLIVQHIQPIEPTLLDVLCEYNENHAAILNKLIAMGKVSIKEVISACKVMKHESDQELAAWDAREAERRAKEAL